MRLPVINHPDYVAKINEDIKYKVYTNKYDKIVRAEEYCKRNELIQ